ncbi:hypothetical protein OAM93_03300 [Candidatus Pelagibacter sp.]|nr:hypothetical protein [Candidatus Pelagibacter sp.]
MIVKIKYFYLFYLLFILSSCSTTGNDQGITIYEDGSYIFGEGDFRTDEIKLKRKKTNKIIIQPNSKPPELRFKTKASTHCKKYGRVSQIKSIQPEFKMYGEVVTRYHEEYICKPTS